MLSLAWMFWLVVFVAFAVGRRRRWRRSAMMGPYGYAAYPWRWERGDYAAWARRPEAPGVPRELEEQRASVEALETRIAQLEERLDFTERLLAGRREPPAGA